MTALRPSHHGCACNMEKDFLLAFRPGAIPLNKELTKNLSECFNTSTLRQMTLLRVII